MITCLNIPENATAYDYVYNIALEKDDIAIKTCLVMPTEKNVRHMANRGLKYVEIYSISNISDILNDSDTKILPEELRPFYLKKAINKLTQEEISQIFKQDNKEFLSSFIPLIQNVNSIFTFYRELFGEQIDLKDLFKASQYSDYEKEINILNNLWNIYIDLIHTDGFIDEFETYININLNKLFIDRYDNYIFLVSGFLRKHQMGIIKKIGEKKDVTIIFNYAGEKDSQHKEYEKFFESDNLKDKKMPIISNNNMQIYSCLSNISQIDLIVKKAFEINQKNNIPFNKMAVILPDSSCKTYFISLDYYNIFNISDGRDIQTFHFYNLLNNVSNLKPLINNDLIEIENIINIINDYDLLQNESAKNLYNDLNELVNDDKLYINKNELLEKPFVIDFLADIVGANNSGKIIYFINIFKSFLNKLKNLFILEKDKIEKVISHLDKLEIIYKNIDDKIIFEEASYIIINSINQIKIEMPQKEIVVMGILSSQNADYDILFIPYMTEEFFPPKSKKDLFLNREIRHQLNLPTFIDRENLMKNYLYQLISNAKLTIMSYANNANIMRSSFIEEISIKNNIKELKYNPSNISLIKDSIYHYPKDDNIISVEKHDEIITFLKDFKYSASSLNTYLTCSLKFYLKYFLKIKERQEPITSLDSRLFGTIIHNCFENLFKNKIYVTDDNYLENFKAEYLKEVEKLEIYKYSNVEKFISNIIHSSIENIVNCEIDHADLGYKEIKREEKISITFNDFNIYGKIDKIEEDISGAIAVTDYKYKKPSDVKTIQNKKSKKKSDNESDDKFDFDKVEDIQLPIYALLIEKHMKRLPENLFYCTLREDFQYKNGFDIALYDDFKDFLAGKLDEIIDINIPFIQTEESKKCNFCEYATICGRENDFFRK